MATQPTLAMIPSGYKDGKLYSVLPSDGVGDFTFDRGNGSSTRINKQKLIEGVSNDVPRLDYGISDCPALLLEPSRTNLLPYSEEFTNSAWAKSSTTITPFYSISPDGSATASLLQRTSSSANYMSEAVFKSATATQVTGSWFIKKGNGDFLATRIQGLYPARVDLIYQHSTKSIVSVVANTFTIIDSDVEEYANGFVKISLSVLTDSHGSVTFACSPNSDASQIDGSGSSADSNVIIWGAQLEVGSYASSYIPTLTGSSQTRLAETANGAGNASTFNDSEGVLMYQIKPISLDGTYKRITLSDGTSANRIIMGFDSNNNVTATVYDGVNQAVLGGDYNAKDELSKYALKYKVNDFALWVNGFEVSTDTNGNTFPNNTLNQLKYEDGNGGVDFYGNTKQLQYFNTALSDLEIETLTSYTSFNEMVLNFNYTIQ